MTKTLQQHFERFDYVDSDIKKGLFPLLDVSDKLEYKVFNFGDDISSEAVVKRIKELGYEPATFSEFLAWPHWNEKDIIVALGSVGEVSGFRHVPYLDRDGSRRGLGLYWWDDDWFSFCHFLGVRNSDLKTSDPLNPALVPLDALILGRIEKKLDVLLNHLGIKP